MSLIGKCLILLKINLKLPTSSLQLVALGLKVGDIPYKQINWSGEKSNTQRAHSFAHFYYLKNFITPMVFFPLKTLLSILGEGKEYQSQLLAFPLHIRTTSGSWKVSLARWMTYFIRKWASVTLNSMYILYPSIYPDGYLNTVYCIILVAPEEYLELTKKARLHPVPRRAADRQTLKANRKGKGWWDTIVTPTVSKTLPLCFNRPLFKQHWLFL